MKTPMFVSVCVLVLVTAAPPIVSAQEGVDPRPPNGATNQKPAVPGQTDAPERKSNVAFDVVTVVEGLQNPWSVAFLPDGKMLVTERPGRLRVVSDGKLSEPVAGLPPVDAREARAACSTWRSIRSLRPTSVIYWSYLGAA